MPNYKLLAKDDLTKRLKQKGITTWFELTNFIKHLPYGRNSDRRDLSLVLKEEKGTCSSKHAFLKHVADLNTLPDIKLHLAIYKMNHLNTPKIGTILIENNIEFIPEAHCYLSVAGERRDYTTSNSDFQCLENAILLEQDIQPFQVVEFKVDFHKAFIKQWMATEYIPFSFNDIWSIREVCIKNLTL